MNAIEIVPVVQMEPWDYSDRALPDAGSRWENPEAWDEYTRACLADVGITLTSIAPASDHFPISALDDRAITKLVEVALRDIPEPLVDPEDTIGALAGGLALRVGPELLVEPGCCAGLDDLAGWEQVLTDASAEFAAIWTGHDHGLVEARVVQNAVELRCRAPWLSDQRTIAIETERFAIALRAARELQRAFAARVATMLVSIAPEQREIVAKLMAGV